MGRAPVRDTTPTMVGCSVRKYMYQERAIICMFMPAMRPMLANQ